MILSGEKGLDGNSESAAFVYTQAIASRNRLKSVAKQREAQQQQLRALIIERRAELERSVRTVLCQFITDRIREGGNTIASVRLSVRLFPLYLRSRLTIYLERFLVIRLLP